MENATDRPKMALFTSRNIIIALVALLVLSIAAGAYFYTKATKDPNAEAAKELAQVVAQVGRLIVLPEGETPTLATVSDPAKLKDQAFFAKAKAGDKVLIYPQSKKAILYSPELNKIIEVSPVTLGQ